MSRAPVRAIGGAEGGDGSPDGGEKKQAGHSCSRFEPAGGSAKGVIESDERNTRADNVTARRFVCGRLVLGANRCFERRKAVGFGGTIGGLVRWVIREGGEKDPSGRLEKSCDDTITTNPAGKPGSTS